jgi:cytochrome c peroxidase
MKYKLIFGILSTSTLLFFSCSSGDSSRLTLEDDGSAYDLTLSDKLDIFKPLSAKALNPGNESTPEKVKLGHALYFDTRLSKEGNISCNSCHNLAAFGVDNLPTSPGDDGTLGDRNSPTVLNAALHSMQFWDGRAKDVEEQAGMPILNPVEMAIPSKEFLVNRLKGIDLYVEMFKEAFPNDPNPLNYTNIEKAIAAFERELLTPSRFDKYLAGDKSALSVQEKKGLLSFILTGCTTCHSGELLGGNSYQRFGVYDDYWKHTNSKKIDKGLAEVTGKELDEYLFKVPSLRNIEKTWPYLHDGSIESLSETIDLMGHIQLNRKLTKEQVENIEAFLKSLTGNVPKEFQKAPEVISSL